MSRCWYRTLLLVLLPLAGSGCHVLPSWVQQRRVDLPPPAFVQSPSLEDVTFVVNTNTQRVEQFQTDGASLRVTDSDFPIPPLSAVIAYQQPLNFRLQAQLSPFTGREIDLGSNPDLFWFWARMNEQPGVYYARHSQFAQSPARDLVPIQPDQLIQALGLVRLEPHHQHSQPTPRDSLLEVRSQLPTPRGNMTRVLLLDPKYGWVVQQHLYDANGQLLLSATASEHRYYRDKNVSMPHHLEIQLAPGQPTQLAFEVDVSRFLFSPLTGAGDRWTMPRIDGSPAVDITDPTFYPPVAARPYLPPTGPLPRAAPGTSWPATSPPASYYSYGPPGAEQPRTGYEVPQRMATLPEMRGYR